jgi:hypothetical protein
MSFGFAVGDSIAAIEMFAIVMSSMLSEQAAKPQHNLATAQATSEPSDCSTVLAVPTLDIDESLFVYKTGLQKAASQCLGTIADF